MHIHARPSKVARKKGHLCVEQQEALWKGNKAEFGTNPAKARDGTRRSRCDWMLHLLDSNLAQAKESGFVLRCAPLSLLSCSTRKLSGFEVLIPTQQVCLTAPRVHLSVSRSVCSLSRKQLITLHFLGCSVLFSYKEIVQNTYCRLVILEFSIQTITSP